MVALLRLGVEALQAVTQCLLVEAESLLREDEPDSDDVGHLEEACSQVRLAGDDLDQAAKFIA